MSYITNLLTAFCAACVIIGALYMLCPDGALSKPVKYLLGLVFLLSIIAASGIRVAKTDSVFPPFEPTHPDSALLDSASAEFAYGICLEKAGIDFSEITVCTDKSDNGSIIISKVIIRSECKREEILAALGEAAENIEVEVINE